MSRRLTIYGNWSVYDELSDQVPLTEELAMGQMAELLRMRLFGVKIDAYLMDAFWFDSEGGYRTWRKPNWPEGPDRWLAACLEHDLLLGLWFTANTLCHIRAASAWQDSVDSNGWGMCCFEGGFFADYLDVLDEWYRRGIRIFKLDFADFSAAPPAVKATMSEADIRARNVEAFRNGLARFRTQHPDAILMGFNGFELREYMNRTDLPAETVIDPAWLEVFDSIYSGDPRPADVPTMPFWRSVDIYGDHMTRVLEGNRIPLAKIDNCGFMAGPTGTCYWRGKAMWKGMFLLTLMRGGDLTVLYGDLRQFGADDVIWMAKAQGVIEHAFTTGAAASFGGLPGHGEPYGWLVAGRLCAVVNPKPTVSDVTLPPGDWLVAFQDAGFEVTLQGSARLGPYQMALLSLESVALGVQDDCLSEELALATFTVLGQANGALNVETASGNLRVVVRQRDAAGRLVRNYPSADSPANVIAIQAAQGGLKLDLDLDHTRPIWSGASWAIADIASAGDLPVQIMVASSDPEVAALELEVWSGRKGGEGSGAGA